MSFAKFGKIAIIAGGGYLPVRLAEFCKKDNIDFIISRIDGLSDGVLDSYDGHTLALGQFGKRFAALKAAGVKSVAMVGYVKRPDFSKLGLDAKGLTLVPKLISAGKKGDDALLRAVIGIFESEGFNVIGAEELQSEILGQAGAIGNISPNENDLKDIEIGIQIAKEIGRLDIGQGCVICDGVVLAVEAQEGTDNMLKRIIDLPEHLRGNEDNLHGILVKCPKPNQEMRIDLPTIGLNTLLNAHNACLKGVAFAANKTIMLDKDALIEKANELNMFLYGFSDVMDK